MLDLVAIAQSAPGAIAVNGAIVVGYKLAGIIGTIVAIIATILPTVYRHHDHFRFSTKYFGTIRLSALCWKGCK